jgi:hypothetical protein
MDGRVDWDAKGAPGDLGSLTPDAAKAMIPPWRPVFQAATPVGWAGRWEARGGW